MEDRSGPILKMFVRFKSKTTRAGKVYNLSLQRSYRDPSRLGNVRSQTLAGLGSVLQSPGPYERNRFWLLLDARLAYMLVSGALSTDDIDKIKASVNEKISRH